MGTTTSGSICISPIHPTTSLLQLETRPIGRGNGCIQPDMGNIQRLCKPSMVLSRQSSVSSAAKHAQVILVAPVWKGQPWYPVLLEMLYDYPQQLPRTLSLFQQTSDASRIDLVPQLAVWPISGRWKLFRSN